MNVHSSTSWPSREIKIDKVKSQDMREEKECKLIGLGMRVSTIEVDSIKHIHTGRENT